MSSPALQRPQKVTTACIFAGLTSLILLVSVSSTLTNWGSVELTEEVSKALAKPPLDGLDISVADAMAWLRIALMGAAALAASGVIFAIYTARGHQASRVILTVMAVLASMVFVTSGLWGLLPAAFSIGSACYLWSYDARVWFAAKNGKKGPAPRTPAPPPSPVPAMAHGWAPTPPPGDFAAAPVRPPYPHTAYPPLYGARAPRRPPSVTTAVITAMIASGVVAGASAIMVLSYLASPSEFAQLLEDNSMLKSRDVLGDLSMSATELARWIFVGSLAVGILSTVGFVAGLLALLGQKFGRLLLLGMSIITVPVAAVFFPVGLAWSAAAIVVIVQLMKADAKAWFSPQG
ncbi:hypothetical protein BH09ACT10_BH09ACT10_16860 [soil metagenome]